MTKLQINYLLLLLTALVGWCYFSTFYKEAKMDARIQNQMAQVMAARPPISSQAYPYGSSAGIRSQPSYMQNLPPDTQKMLENFRAARKAAATPALPPNPDANSQEKK